MCNFNNQSKETQDRIHLFMQKAAKSIGGVNYLLSLIEALRKVKPNPLMQKNMQIASNNTIIKWNKVVFKDKVESIEKILLSHKNAQENDFNILNEENKKVQKNILNMVRTLTPVKFEVLPQNPNDGEGFSFEIFDTISDEEVKFNPIFIALFFCSINFTKSALKHTI